MITLDQLSQTVEVMAKVINRLKFQLDHQQGELEPQPTTHKSDISTSLNTVAELH